MSIIEIKALNKKYNEGKRNEVYALRGIELEITKGESIAIMGVSGSGKSTLLNIIGCLDVPTEGEYLLESEKVSEQSATELARTRNKTIGFILQSFGLIESDSVFKNIKLPLLFSRKFTSKEAKARVEEMLKLVNIEPLTKTKVKNLSGGERQRVAIARALVNNPSIILADEPTSALDSKTASEIMSIFKKLQAKGKTIIIVTHDPNIAKQMDRTVYIKDGIISDSIE